jgi:hypothetical protein
MRGEKDCIVISVEELIANELLQQNDWFYLSRIIKLDLNLIQEFKSKLNWSSIIANPSFTIDLIDYLDEEIKNKLNWNRISRHKEMTPEFIDKYKYYINWEDFFEWNKLPEGYKLIF